MESVEELAPNEIKQQEKGLEGCGFHFSLGFSFAFILYLVLPIPNIPHIIQVSDEIKVLSMDFTAELNDNSTTQQSHNIPLASARWDLMIRVPEKLGKSVCLRGHLQASFLYKNIALVTSFKQSYESVQSSFPQFLSVSATASGEDLGGAIGKEIMEANKERKEVWFGLRLHLIDCIEETEKGMISYECDEASLRFESGFDQIKALSLGNHPSCTVAPSLFRLLSLRHHIHW